MYKHTNYKYNIMQLSNALRHRVGDNIFFATKCSTEYFNYE